LGDIEKSNYAAERDRLKPELALAGMRLQSKTSHLGRLAELLASVAAAWTIAQLERHNPLARLLFGEIVINDDRVVAVKPRPDLAGFFLLDYQ
jgi:hypothetical protein